MNAAPRDPAAAGWSEWAGVAVVCLAAVLAAVLEALLVPLYIGGVIAPIAVLMAVASNIALPNLAYRLVARPLAAGLPFAAWLVVIFAFGVVARPEGDVILPGGGPEEWVSYGVMLGGALVGTITVVLIAPSRARRPPPSRPRPGPR